MCDRPLARRPRPPLALALLTTLGLGLGLGLGLAGCGGEGADVQITGIELSPDYDIAFLRDDLLAIEPHNAPFPGMSAAEAARLVALPEGLPPDLAPPAVAPGGWARAEHGRLLRLAVIFDPEDRPTGAELCRARAPLQAPPAQAGATAVSAVIALCLRDQPLAYGRVRAKRSGPITPDWTAQVMGQLTTAVFGRGPLADAAETGETEARDAPRPDADGAGPGDDRQARAG